MAVKNIRRDIYSVKEWDRALDAWCHIKMFKSKESARNYASVMTRSRIKIVHPAQWVVDGYIAAGNVIPD